MKPYNKKIETNLVAICASEVKRQKAKRAKKAMTTEKSQNLSIKIYE